MSISEHCSCGASFDTVPGLEFTVASKFAREWRRTHRHDGRRPDADDKPPMGFTTFAVSRDFNDGEDEDDDD